MRRNIQHNDGRSQFAHGRCGQAYMRTCEGTVLGTEYSHLAMEVRLSQLGVRRGIRAGRAEAEWKGCQMSQTWMSNDEGRGEIKHDASMTGDHTKRCDIARQEMTVRWSGPRSRLEKGPARHGESRARAFILCMGMGTHTHTHTGRTQGRAGGAGNMEAGRLLSIDQELIQLHGVAQSNQDWHQALGVKPQVQIQALMRIPGVRRQYSQRQQRKGSLTVSHVTLCSHILPALLPSQRNHRISGQPIRRRRSRLDL